MSDASGLVGRRILLVKDDYIAAQLMAAIHPQRNYGDSARGHS